MTIVDIACRNIWRNRRRSLLSAAAIAVAVALLVFAMALQEGAHIDFVNNAVRVHAGHIQVQASGYLTNRDPAYSLTAPEQVMELAHGIPHVVGCAPRVNVSALLSRGEKTFGALLCGIDPEREAETSILPRLVRQGRYLETTDRNGVILSETLARNLDARVGDEVVFIGQCVDGSMAAGKLTVRGIVKFGLQAMDSAFAAASIETVRDAFSLGNRASEVAVLLDNDAAREAVKPALRRRLHEKGIAGAVVLGWPEILPGVEQTILVDWTVGRIMCFVLVLVLGFCIANTFLMAYMERLHEYGVLHALGMRPSLVALMTFLESVILTLVGVSVGAVTGAGVTLYYQVQGMVFSGHRELFDAYGMNPVLHPRATLSVLAWAVGLVFSVTVLMALYPALRSSRLQPVEGLRHRGM